MAITAMRIRNGIPLLPIAMLVATWLVCAGSANAQETSEEKAATPVAAGSVETVPYAELVDRAVVEFAAGHFIEARALFERAHALQPNARTLRGLGITAFELRRYTQAREELEAALQDTRHPLTPELRQEVMTALARAREFVGTVEIVVQPRDARVLIDGAEVPRRQLELDVGEYDVVVTAAGYRAANVRVIVRGGKRQSVTLQLFQDEPTALPPSTADSRRFADSPPAAPALHERWWFWAGALAVVGGTVLGAVLLSGGDEEASPAPGSVGGVVQVLGRAR